MSDPIDELLINFSQTLNHDEKLSQKEDEDEDEEIYLGALCPDDYSRLNDGEIVELFNWLYTSNESIDELLLHCKHSLLAVRLEHILEELAYTPAIESVPLLKTFITHHANWKSIMTTSRKHFSPLTYLYSKQCDAQMSLLMDFGLTKDFIINKTLRVDK
jgi:hypothetical protein